MFIKYAISGVGIIIGIYFFVVNAREKQSLTGSFFKRNHQLIAIGAAMFASAFALEILTAIVAEKDLTASLSNFCLISSGVLFVKTRLSLPKEISKLMRKET